MGQYSTTFPPFCPKTSILGQEVLKIHAYIKTYMCLKGTRIAEIFASLKVEKHDGNVRFKSGSGNMAVSCMRNASGHNYRNSSFIVTWLWGRYHVPQNVFLVE